MRGYSGWEGSGFVTGGFGGGGGNGQLKNVGLETDTSTAAFTSPSHMGSDNLIVSVLTAFPTSITPITHSHNHSNQKRQNKITVIPSRAPPPISSLSVSLGGITTLLKITLLYQK